MTVTAQHDQRQLGDVARRRHRSNRLAATSDGDRQHDQRQLGRLQRRRHLHDSAIRSIVTARSRQLRLRRRGVRVAVAGAYDCDVNHAQSSPMATISDWLRDAATACWSNGATITDNGGNLIGTAAAPIDPLLGRWPTTAGRRSTHALLAGSPAINRGRPECGGRRGRRAGV